MDKYSEVILNVIFTIKRKPGCYLGTKSVTHLRSFLDGFSWGYNFPGIGSSPNVNSD